MNFRRIHGLFLLLSACFLVVVSCALFAELSFAGIEAPFLEGLNFSTIQNQGTAVPESKESKTVNSTPLEGITVEAPEGKVRIPQGALAGLVVAVIQNYSKNRSDQAHYIHNPSAADDLKVGVPSLPEGTQVESYEYITDWYKDEDNLKKDQDDLKLTPQHYCQSEIVVYVLTGKDSQGRMRYRKADYIVVAHSIGNKSEGRKLSYLISTPNAIVEAQRVVATVWQNGPDGKGVASSVSHKDVTPIAATYGNQLDRDLKTLKNRLPPAEPVAPQQAIPK